MTFRFIPIIDTGSIVGVVNVDSSLSDTVVAQEAKRYGFGIDPELYDGTGLAPPQFADAKITTVVELDNYLSTTPRISPAMKAKGALPKAETPAAAAATPAPATPASTACLPSGLGAFSPLSVLEAPLRGDAWRKRSDGAALGAPPAEFAMLWSPGGQLMTSGSDAFSHDGSIGTAPSHDLAHLLVAAHSPTLPWRPAGDPAGVSLAEYNAVAHEHLLDRVYRVGVGGEGAEGGIVSGLLGHLEWFVDKHFAPFPVSSKKALSLHLAGLNDDAAVRLSPYFFTMKHAERSDPGYMGATWSARFKPSDRPPGWTGLQGAVVRQLQKLRAAASP